MDVLIIYAAIAQRSARAVEEHIRKVIIKTRADDRKPGPRAVRQRRRDGAVGLHDAATSSKMWPSFERLVSM